MRRIPIRFKLALSLVPPSVLLVAVVALKAVEASWEAGDVRREVRLMQAAVGPSGLFTWLQVERNSAALGLIDVPKEVLDPGCDLEGCRAATDESLARFSELISDDDSEVRRAYAPGLDAVARLGDLRATTDLMERVSLDEDSKADAADEVFAAYSEIIDALLDTNVQVTVEIDDRFLRRGAELTYLASRQSNITALLVRDVLVVGSSPGQLDQREEITRVASLHHQALSGERDLREVATGGYARFVEEVQDSRVPFYEELARIAETGRIDVARMLEITGQTKGYGGDFRDQVRGILEQRADAVVGAANRRVHVYWAVVVAATAVAIGAAWRVSRSITRPLRALALQATEMAERRLPEAVGHVLGTMPGEDVVVPEVLPVSIDTGDQVADLAAVLNTVQSRALELALGQAVLRRNLADAFLNMGRRNQHLLDRQLEFITVLEQEEADPDTLGDLFRLDHLATRMRRNAESLLVVAGVDTPRDLSAPVPVADVVRSALGEVEDYRRVTVHGVEAATIVGSAVADLVHLLAELIENALLYSPPHTTVEISGRNQPVGAPRRRSPGTPSGDEDAPLTITPGYTISIVDAGIGMSPTELVQANRRLAGAESFTVAPSKYLGHYVAGLLGRRHDIVVTLHNSPAPSGSPTGVTATIDLASDILMTVGFAYPWAVGDVVVGGGGRATPGLASPSATVARRGPGPVEAGGDLDGSP